MDTDVQTIMTYYDKLNENYDIWKNNDTITSILKKNTLTNVLKMYHPYMTVIELSSLTLAIYIHMMCYANNI